MSGAVIDAALWNVEYKPKYSHNSPGGESLTINALVTPKYHPEAIHHMIAMTYKTRCVEEEKNIRQLRTKIKQVSISIFLYPNLSASFPNTYPKNKLDIRKITKTKDFIDSLAW